MFTRRHLVLLCVAVLPALSGCESGKKKDQPAEAQPAENPALLVREFLGDDAIALLRSADKVEVFRVDPTTGPDLLVSPSKGTTTVDGRKYVGGFAVTAEGKPMDAAFARQLAATMTTPATYNWLQFKFCGFKPGVAYRVTRGDQSFTLLACFMCSEMEAVTENAVGEPTRRRRRYFLDRAAMISLAKQAFPDDEVVQGLK